MSVIFEIFLVRSKKYLYQCHPPYITRVSPPNMIYLQPFLDHVIHRSSHTKVFFKKGVLKIYSKFTKEHPCRSVISIQLQSNFIEIALWHGCSLVNLLHIFRTSSPRNASGWLLLNICITYLHVTEACLKFTFAMVNFCHSENPSSFMKNVFNSISIYS